MIATPIHYDQENFSIFLPKTSESMEQLLEPTAVTPQAQQRRPAKFPMRLHQLLEDAITEGFEHIVSWLPSGKAFRVHNSHAFENHVISRYFRQTRYKSFQRQLNLYGFERIQSGEDTGAYFHKLFVRNQFHLLNALRRMKVVPKDSPTVANTRSSDGMLPIGSDSTASRQQDHRELSSPTFPDSRNDERISKQPPDAFSDLLVQDLSKMPASNTCHTSSNNSHIPQNKQLGKTIESESRGRQSTSKRWDFKVEPRPINPTQINIAEPRNIVCNTAAADALRWLFAKQEEDYSIHEV